MKDKKKHKMRVMVSLEDAISKFTQNAKKEDLEEAPPKKDEQPTPPKKEEPKPTPKPQPAEEKKPDSLNKVKKRVEAIKKAHLDHLPEPTRIPTTKDIKAWIVNNLGQNINSPQFLSWIRNPDGNGLNPYVKDFGTILTELGLDYVCETEVKGYVFDFFIPAMSLYIDIDPISLETDNPKDKINITIDKNKVDVLSVWRTINESREGRCKPYRFMAIKERIYAAGLSDFLKDYIDWYYQKMCEDEKK